MACRRLGSGLVARPRRARARRVMAARLLCEQRPMRSFGRGKGSLLRACAGPAAAAWRRWRSCWTCFGAGMEALLVVLAECWCGTVSWRGPCCALARDLLQLPGVVRLPGALCLRSCQEWCAFPLVLGACGAAWMVQLVLGRGAGRGAKWLRMRRCRTCAGCSSTVAALPMTCWQPQWSTCWACWAVTRVFESWGT